MSTLLSEHVVKEHTQFTTLEPQLSWVQGSWFKDNAKLLLAWDERQMQIEAIMVAIFSMTYTSSSSKLWKTQLMWDTYYNMMVKGFQVKCN